MPRISLDQGTPAWHEWRKNKLTASRIAQIMGCSPYGTPYSLWCEMTGRVPPQKWNDSMKYGERMEPLIRAYWEEKTDTGYLPCCYNHPEIHYIGASLDGIDLDEQNIIEIKACNKEVFDLAKEGQVVDHYNVQMQVQLICVPSAKSVTAIFVNGVKDDKITEENVAVNTVTRDENLIKEILSTCEEFCSYLESDNAPPLTENDYVYLGFDEEFISAEKVWLEAQEQLKWAEAVEKEAKSKLFLMAQDRNCRSDRVKISKIQRKGPIDWKMALKALGIDELAVEYYRKNTIEFLQVSLIK